MVKLFKNPFIGIILVAIFVLFGSKLIDSSAFSHFESPKYEGLVIELDQDLKKVWKTDDYYNPGCLNKCRNGDRLISDNFTGFTYKVNSEGQIKWAYPAVGNVFIEETIDGTYVSSSDWGCQGVLEVDKFGNTLWQIKETYGRAELHKLGPDRYLVAQLKPGFVKIFNNKQEVVKVITENVNPGTIQPLDGNRFLVTDHRSRTVLELDYDGNVVWDFNNNNEEPIAARKINDNEYVISYLNATVLLVDKNKNVKKCIKKILATNISLMPDGHIGLAGVRR